MALRDVREIHGPPSTPCRLSDFYTDIATDDLWTHVWENLGINVVTLGRDSQRIVTIVARSAEYRSEKGIGAGSTRQAVEAAYGRPIAVTSGGVSVYDEIGLSVRIDAGVVVYAVVVFRPGSAKTIWKY